MKHILKVVLAVGLVMALATSASALTAGFIPTDGTNDFIGPVFVGPTIQGYYGGQIYLNAGGATQLTLAYYGAEAGYHNEFNFNGIERFAHGGGTNIATDINTPLASVNVIANPGLLNFSFDFNSDAGSVVNGLNIGQPGPNFFVSFTGMPGIGGPTSGQYVWLFLDDGASVDDNHDDMVVRISVTGGNFSVPEPATMLLLGLGLIGLAGLRRK